MSTTCLTVLHNTDVTDAEIDGLNANIAFCTAMRTRD